MKDVFGREVKVGDAIYKDLIFSVVRKVGLKTCGVHKIGAKVISIVRAADHFPLAIDGQWHNEGVFNWREKYDWEIAFLPCESITTYHKECLIASSPDLISRDGSLMSALFTSVEKTQRFVRAGLDLGDRGYGVFVMKDELMMDFPYRWTQMPDYRRG